MIRNYKRLIERKIPFCALITSHVLKANRYFLYFLNVIIQNLLMKKYKGVFLVKQAWVELLMTVL